MAVVLNYVLCLLLGLHSVLCCDPTRVNMSQLCNPPHTEYNISCSKQLPGNFSDGDCTLIFEKNTQRCLSQKIVLQELKQSSQTVHLKVYQFNNFFYVRPSFNVTMTNIKWNDPCNRSIESHETLAYLDLTSRPHLKLHIQKLPVHLKVHEYEVKQCFCTECSLQHNFEECVHVVTAEAGSEDIDELTVPINIAEETGSFFYIVYAKTKIHGNRRYYISHTETITNVNLKGMLMWSAVGLFILLSILIIGSIFGTKYATKLLAEGLHNMTRHRVLMLHHPVHRVHMCAVISLAQFLEQYCNIDVSLDIRDIPQTENKDPLFWYNSEISSANFIAIISTPPCNDGQEATYKDLHIVGLNFIRELLRSKTSKTKIFTIILPYCDETGIPVLARHLKRIWLMKDIDSMISLIHGDTSNMNFSCGQQFCIRKALLRNIHQNLRLQGSTLKSYIAEMENIIKQSGKNEHVIKGPVYEELESVVESEKETLTLRKSVIEIPKHEEPHDENSVTNINDMNQLEFSLSDIDLTGLDNSVEVSPRISRCHFQTYEFFCDDLQL